MSDYVEMTCDLTVKEIHAPDLPPGITFKSIAEIPADALYECYHAAFAAGDAAFFFEQSEYERREFFDTLGLDAAREEPASVVLYDGARLIGFSLVLPYGSAANRHISCMVIDPGYQRRGLGRALLHEVMREAQASDVRTFTLGTDRSMRAFDLYQSEGFVIEA